MSLLSLLSPQEKKLIQKKAMPTFIKPMLATLTRDYFSRKNWIFECKLDGERCLLFKKGNKIILKSRNNKIINDSYPEIVAAAHKLNLPDCILDGEIVAFKNKVSNFSLLQGRFGVNNPTRSLEAQVPVYYYVFDILYCDNYLLTHLPLLTRKKILKNLITFNKTICYVTHKNTEGLKYYKQACSLQWEGLIAKRADSIYVSKRSPDWLKFKCVNEEELVIGGYTNPGGSRTHFGALLLGYYKNKKLQYAGKVGTGFNEKILKELGALLKKYTTNICPFVNYDDPIANVHWVKPILVCEVRFSEWTKDNKLRHPSYLGLRVDKDAKAVVQEK